jgi:inward rectifier potassium channel
MHVIDETSPLHGETLETLENTQSAFLLSIEGIDETTSQSMLARRQWSHQDLRWNHRYLDLVSDDGKGLNIIDYGIFHAVLPLDEGEHLVGFGSGAAQPSGDTLTLSSSLSSKG